MKNISILGSTGSIGVSTLQVVEQFPEHFQVIALAAGRNADLLINQIRRFRPRLAAVMDQELATIVTAALGQEDLQTEVLYGPQGYEQVATHPEIELVVSAMVGAAGLLPTIAAVSSGKHLALANKETLVIAGEIVMDLAAKQGIRILPVDSEHSAIFQALQGNHRHALRRILLTASGGPFFHKSRDELASVTPQAALRHPNWSMGQKITIDSSTLMNKGLEAIEAHWLFGVPVEQIHVHIHPESIVHSMVEYIDGSVIAQMGIPDMRIPIAYALAFPERLPVQGPPLDLFRLQNLSFYPPDEEKFPCLQLAYEACKRGFTVPAVLNAANEIAVQAFLESLIGFLDIPRIIRRVIEKHNPDERLTLDAVLSADAWARQEAAHEIKKDRA
ncbi:MAG: 1-deoxy-D-xylulose-5-phosphate reductoisomerase [Deltaproteobacteria bacterium]|nr:1-deoxy-D-xylulose-5-phosphate reductoisomerase [Deltaproteobacteria bacterium]